MIKKNLSNLRSLQYVVVFFFLLLGSTLLTPHIAFSCDSCNELFSLNVSKGVCPSSLYDALNSEIGSKDKVDNLEINIISPDEQSVSLPLILLMMKMISPLNISLNLEKDEGEDNSEFDQKINPSNAGDYVCYYLAYETITNFIDCLVYGYSWDCSSALSYALLYYLFCS